MKPTLLLALAVLAFGSVSGHADSFDSRAVLGVPAGLSIDAAVKRAKKENKKVLVFALDEQRQNQAFHIKGMLELEETKKLVREHFLIVVTDFKDKHIRDQIGSDGTDRPMYFVFSGDGKIMQKGTTAVGASVGNKLVKEWTGK